MRGGKGKLIAVSAPSGSGKTTLVHHLLSSGLGLEFSVSATSRPQRPGEVDGRDYHFLSPEEFQNRARSGDFVEWEEVYQGVYYGTLRSEVESRIDQGRHVIFDVDVKGGLNIKDLYGVQALCIFIQPPSLQELERRLRLRSSDPEESILKRLEKSAWEMGFSTRFDHIIVNDELEKSKNEIRQVVWSFLTGT
jgi:guanylate kinase